MVLTGDVENQLIDRRIVIGIRLSEEGYCHAGIVINSIGNSAGCECKCKWSVRVLNQSP